MKFCLVSEQSVPDETVRLLRDACGDRGIPFQLVMGKAFEFDPAQRLASGDLLYRAAVSLAATRAEQFLCAPGVATFYTRGELMYFAVSSQTLLVQSAGVATPATVYLASADSGMLRRQAERLGGFPVVVKVLGRSSGVGVMLAESMASLKSIVDFVLAQGHNPLLCQFIADALHWRVIVLGGRAIASYRNKRVPDDFRSTGSNRREDFDAVPPSQVVEAAVRATRGSGLEFAGVDVLEDPDGKAWFLEANFPTYYPQAQLYGGVDIAGQMVDYLAEKGGALAMKNALKPSSPEASSVQPGNAAR